MALSANEAAVGVCRKALCRRLFTTCFNCSRTSWLNWMSVFKMAETHSQSITAVIFPSSSTSILLKERSSCRITVRSERLSGEGNILEVDWSVYEWEPKQSWHLLHFPRPLLLLGPLFSRRQEIQGRRPASHSLSEMALEKCRSQSGYLRRTCSVYPRQGIPLCCFQLLSSTKVPISDNSWWKTCAWNPSLGMFLPLWFAAFAAYLVMASNESSKHLSFVPCYRWSNSLSLAASALRQCVSSSY